MPEHSVEPWGLTVIGDCNRIRITDADGFRITDLDTEILEGKQLANAKRMRACVNALAGLKPEKVKGLVEIVHELWQALVSVHKWTTDDNCDLCALLTKAEALLAEVKA